MTTVKDSAIECGVTENLAGAGRTTAIPYTTLTTMVCAYTHSYCQCSSAVFQLAPPVVTLSNYFPIGASFFIFFK